MKAFQSLANSSANNAAKKQTNRENFNGRKQLTSNHKNDKKHGLQNEINFHAVKSVNNTSRPRKQQGEIKLIVFILLGI